MSVGGQVVVMNQEMRNCTSSLMCNRDAVCKIANNSLSGRLEKCELGCCKGDLCNTGAIPTSAPKPTGPTGSDLSCYSCSSGPFNIPGFSVAKTDCTNPVKQTCGPDIIPGLQQDRCVRIKVKVGGVLAEIRNCSGISFCNSDVFCKTVNQSGMITSCDVSCCHGNLCNSDDAAPTTLPPKGTTLPESTAATLPSISNVSTTEKPTGNGGAGSLPGTLVCFLVLAARGLVELADMM